ncbi:DedA family protein [Dendrosporobacter sp. 1207_IL3150]|uniref:DedA family protein n=1 Tax=Dendrosporobacter sp. 1207_IL3150 TaxID=3084054 RepID=UPI002FDAF439
MDELIGRLIEYISIWGYPAISLALLLANVGMPIPSEVTLGFAGFLVFTGQLNFAPVIISGITGELMGACLAYAIGYYGGTAFIEKYGHVFGITFRKIEKRRFLLERYGALTIFFGRLLPVVRGVIAIPAGFIKLDFWVFFLFTGFSSVIWVVLLVYMGQMLGENWRQVDDIGYGLAKAILIMLVLGIIAYLHRKKKVRGFR